ncbi:ubiquinol oxidase subunit II [Buchnera aphidicola (Kurisakia onigurumii)]|uniref:ubiquinol oxidase subunit II n=1 Tax=Buchnera aphidicola TaxID=9 RepID=UPI0031B6744A
MNLIRIIKKMRLVILISLLVSGCNPVILYPQGEIGFKITNLIRISFFMMLCIVIPVIFMTIFFSYKYSKKSEKIQYKPEWSHSNKIESLIWFFPIVIITILSILSWNTTHQLDQKKIIHSHNKAIKINVISLDWRWLFIYPEEKIATINEIVIPVNTPVNFKITSNTVMNSFFIPALGSQIYSMPGMQTNLNLIANHCGNFKGISSNYSGEGFSNMKFSVLVTNNRNSFNKWVMNVKSYPYKLQENKSFIKLLKPNKKYEVIYFSTVNTNFFNLVIKKFSMHQIH